MPGYGFLSTDTPPHMKHLMPQQPRREDYHDYHEYHMHIRPDTQIIPTSRVDSTLLFNEIVIYKFI